MANIHPLATVHPNAKLGENVEVTIPGRKKDGFWAKFKKVFKK